MRYWLLSFLVVAMIGCSPGHKIAGKTTTGNIKEIRFVSEYILPGNIDYRNTIVGGLSGIDYDVKKDVYYMICDDPSTKGPARFYTAKIPISQNGIDSVKIVDVNALLNPAGTTYADITKDRIHSADVEAMRYDPSRDEMIWTSEGQRFMRPGIQDLENPAIVIMSPVGNYKDSFALPANMRISSEEKGPRHNSVFEGVAFDENYSHVFVSVEDALYDDGPRAGTGPDSTAWIRILKFNRNTKEQVAQYAYQIDPVPYPANPPGAFKVNGVSDILYVGNNKFIVVERAWSTGRVPSDIRIYIADATKADDISSIASIRSQPLHRSMKKTLLLDFNTIGRFVDNIEGVTFGPVLPNGHRSLIFVSDDNFDKRQKTQFLLFEIL
jgi:hypothetical protein